MAEATLIARIVAKGQGQAKAAIAAIRQEFRLLRQSNTFGTERILKSLAGLQTAFEKSGTAAQKNTRKVRGFFGALADGGGILGNFRTALVDAFLITGIVRGFIQAISGAVQALFSLHKGAQDVAIEMTGVQIILKAATKSQNEYTTASLRAAEVSRRYGTDLLATSRGLADFLASSKSSNIVFEEQLEIFESLVRVGRVFNLSSEKIKLSILAISQIASKGCHGKGSRIQMADGSVELVERIEVGDSLMGPDGEPRLVLALARGSEDLYRIRPASGAAFVVNHGHIFRGRDSAGDSNIALSDYLSGGDSSAVEWVRGDGSSVGFDVAAEGEGEFFGYMIAGDHLYLDADGFVHHNTVQLEELKRQLGDQIPGVVPGLAKALGITVADLFEKTRSGALDATEGLRALRKVFDELSAEQAVVAAQTLAAELGRLETEAGLVKLAFADATDEGFRAAAEAATQLAKDLQPLATQLGELSSETILPFTERLAQLAGDWAVVTEAALANREATKQQSAEVETLAAILKGRLFPGIKSVREAQANFREELKETAEGLRQIKLKNLTEEFADLAHAARTGGVALTSAFEDSAAARQSAFEQISRISLAVARGLLSEVEARRLLRSIVRDQSQEELVAAELLRIEFENRQRLIEREIAAKVKLARASQQSAEIDRQQAIDNIKLIGEAAQAAEELADTRIAESKRTREEVTAQEAELVSDVLGWFQEEIEGVKLSAGERREIEQELADDVLDIEQKFQEKRAELVADAEEKLKEDAANREEIEEELTEKLVAELEKRSEAFDKAVEKRIAGAKKAADAEVKEAKRATDAWLRLRDAVGGDDDVRRDVSLGVSADDSDAVTFGEAISRLKDQLEALKEARFDAFAAGTDTAQLDDQIANLEQNMVRLAQQGAPTFREEIVSAVGAVSESGERLLSFIDDLVRNNEAFRQSYEGLGGDARESIDRIIATYRSLGENTRITEGDVENFAAQLRAAGAAIPQFASDASGAAPPILEVGTAADKVAGQVDTLNELISRTGRVFVTNTEGAKASADSTEEAGEAAETAGGKLLKLGEDAEVTVGSIKAYRDEQGRVVITHAEVAESAGQAAAAEQNLADTAGEAAENAQIPEEVIASIQRLGATAEATAPLVQPLVDPLTAIAAASTLLKESLPALPAPAAALAASLIALVEKGVLFPMAAALAKIAPLIERLAEKLPGAAGAQERFNLAATNSKQPLTELEAALQKITEEGLVGRLEALATNLDSVNTSLNKLGTDGFANAKAAAAEFEATLFGEGGLEPQMKEFELYLDTTFAGALESHRTDWSETEKSVDDYTAKLITLRDDIYPTVAEAGEDSMRRVKAAVSSAHADLRSLLADLREAVSLSQQL